MPKPKKENKNKFPCRNFKVLITPGQIDVTSHTKSLFTSESAAQIQYNIFGFQQKKLWGRPKAEKKILKNKAIAQSKLKQNQDVEIYQTEILN